MSSSYNARADHDSDEEEEDGNGDDSNNEERREKGVHRKRKRSVARSSCSYKNVVLSPINKFSNLFYRKKAKGSFSQPSSVTNKLLSDNNNNNNDDSSSNVVKVGSNYYYYGGCLFCMSKPQTLDMSSDETDPNDPSIGCEHYVKSLIEQNDFYSKECNTHIGG